MKRDSNIYINSALVTTGIKNLDKIGNRNKAFTVEMLNQFLSSAADCIDGINRSLTQNDWLKLRSVAQENIPSYRLMGFNELADFLKYIEHNALKKDKRKHISILAKSIRKKNEDVTTAIKKYLDLIYLEELKLEIN